MIENSLAQHSIEELRMFFEKKIQLIDFSGAPKKLYEPIKYIMNLGGKRIRPTCTLAAAELFNYKKENVINQSIAVELFHNFTLIHDDIMDKAPLRRGVPTVHEKWDSNTAILSGDAMVILAYQYLSKAAGDNLYTLFTNFNQTAIEVCEGQQFDMDFEQKKSVSLNDYIAMIELKTAVLLGESLRLGATLSGASKKDTQLIYDFGKNFGVAFQLQDDILDLYGNPEKFGKQNGGDIIACKKTYLYAKALEICNKVEKENLIAIYNDITLDNAVKIDSVRAIFNQLNIRDLAKKEMNTYYLKADVALNNISVDSERKIILKEFTKSLMIREL